MPSPLDDARLRSLLNDADRALDMLRDPTRHGRTVDDVMAMLDALHRDLGRRLHDLWSLSEAQANQDLEEIDQLEEISDIEELSEPGDVDTLETTVATYAHSITPNVDSGEWVDDLQDLLALLAAPTSDADAVALAVEASRVQWATVGLRERWPRFPSAIQVALLGMLAARCRYLGEHLAVDLGPQRAMGRLAAYRRSAGLARVVGLVPDRGPESESWTDDAVHWWEMLTAGIRE
jgi:hypothetical protein